MLRCPLNRQLLVSTQYLTCPEKSAFYLPWNSLKASLKKPVKSRHGRHRQLKNNPIIHVDIT